MTLRESEQSLLHNPFHATRQAFQGLKRMRVPTFTPLIATGSTILAATIWLALGTADQFAGSLARYMDGQTATGTATGFKQLNQNTAQNFARADPKIQNDQNRTYGDTSQTDVIIEPLNSPIDIRLKKLTAHESVDSPSPFEIPRNRVFDLLANSSDDNISVSPDLKFFATANSKQMRACPKSINLFEALSDRSNQCFTIKIQPAVKTPETIPSVL